MPHRTSVPIPWRLKKWRYSLNGTKCDCGVVYYPPRKICELCGNKITTDTKLPNNGVIVSFTKIMVPPDGFENITPYIIGLVKLTNGIVISSQIHGPEDKIKINTPVIANFRVLFKDSKNGVIHYGTKFEVIE